MTSRVETHDWGTMTWLADATAGATSTVSVARMVLNAGQSSPLHHHPNCEEVVFLESGAVVHEIDGALVDHEPATCVVIPSGASHFTKNLGASAAHLLVTYGSPAREYVAGASANMPPNKPLQRTWQR